MLTCRHVAAKAGPASEARPRWQRGGGGETLVVRLGVGEEPELGVARHEDENPGVHEPRDLDRVVDEHVHRELAAPARLPGCGVAPPALRKDFEVVVFDAQIDEVTLREPAITPQGEDEDLVAAGAE